MRDVQRHNRRSALALTATAVLLPLLLTTSACGGPADAATGREDLTVMTWSPSDTGAADRPGMTALAEAIGRETNIRGGVAGHKLHVLTCNEHNSATGAAACAKQAVDNGVAAVVGSYSQFGENFMPVLESAGIPFIGGYGLSMPEFSSPLSFPVAGGSPALVAGSGRQLVAAGCRTVALIRPDTPAGDNLVGALVSALKPSGVKLTDIRAKENSSDYTAVAQKAIGDDQQNNCVDAALGPVPTQNVLDSYRRLSHRNTRLASVIGSFQQSVVDSTGGDNGPLGGAYATGWYPAEDSKVWDSLRTTVRTNASPTAQIDVSDPGVQTTWVAYQVFLQALERLNGKTVTAKSLRAVLDSGDQFNTGGATPPLSWGISSMLASAESPRLVNTSVTFQQVQGGRLVEQQQGFVDVRWVLTGGKPPAGS